MEDRDRVRFSEIMIGLAENYSGAQLTAIGLKLRFEAMKEFSIEQIAMAATVLVKTRKYTNMPTVAELIDAIPGHPALEIKPVHQAEIQADQVLAHLRRFGRTVVPQFTDPITRQLMSSRWQYQSWAATIAESELKWWRREFSEAYQAYAESGAPLMLEGPGALRQLSMGIGRAL